MFSQQKHAIWIVYSKDRLPQREIFEQCKVLNVYQVNIWKNLVFWTNLKSPLTITQQTLPELIVVYIPPFRLNKSKYWISIQNPALWKNISTDTEKKQQKTTIFKTIMRNKLLALENKLTYF